MSKEAVIEFLKKADEDSELCERLDRALDDEKGAVKTFLATAAEQEFHFTADEFLEAVQETGLVETSGELSDEALEGVAGGLTFSSRQVSGMASRAFRSFGNLRSGLGIRDIGPGAIMQEVEEEEAQS